MGTLFSSGQSKVQRTTPPGRTVVLYDGLCKFCQAGMKRLLALAKPGAIEPVDFQKPGALDHFPGLTHEACMKQMYLVTRDGEVFGGFEAAVRALATRPILGRLAYVYYLPGVRFLFDWVYATIAKHRYRILGKAVAEGECPEGTCALHAKGQVGSRKTK
jgi:predicted DCC family thiol-disulfide oxidoreductase YuxK